LLENRFLGETIFGSDKFFPRDLYTGIFFLNRFSCFPSRIERVSQRDTLLHWEEPERTRKSNVKTSINTGWAPEAIR